jgi:hypothetical protein
VTVVRIAGGSQAGPRGFDSRQLHLASPPTIAALPARSKSAGSGGNAGGNGSDGYRRDSRTA